MIESNPSISQRKITMLAGVSYDTIRYHMENMRKKQEIIARKGNGRSGKWTVLQAESNYMIYVASITVSVIADIFSIAFMRLTMCLGFILLIAVFVYFGYDISESDTDVFVSGMYSEKSPQKFSPYFRVVMLYFKL